ncbi:hypothetical protein B0H63DRAFT_475134 [Podospora didyma]|uniref:Glycosyl transferase family 25 domain-containing protein n=1 Tax=Podospora didyma TaxID=330526 RepID=A0AAE0TVN1_9PEZI|nr:hypothetical protein B0H63DRAFT_475134 [Podospora didyma]
MLISVLAPSAARAFRFSRVLGETKPWATATPSNLSPFSRIYPNGKCPRRRDLPRLASPQVQRHVSFCKPTGDWDFGATLTFRSQNWSAISDGPSMLYSHRIVAVVLIALITAFVFFRPPRLNSLSPWQYLKATGKTSPEILNGTLGFQQVFVINLPERTDRRDAMTLASALSGIDVTWVDGVSGAKISDKVLPGDSWDKTISRGNKGSWRAHMNALRRVIEQKLTSALILEDDADWDLRIKLQLQVFAQAAKAFTQSTTKAGHPLAELYPHDKPTELGVDLPLTHLPSSTNRALTPYGDNWDVLWLGHCGTEFPARPPIATVPDDSSSGPPPSHRPPLLRVVIPNDGTVPGPSHLRAHPFALPDAMADLYPPHTRIVHASSATTCTQAYAVSQQGARKLLWQFGLQSLTTGWDLMLRDWCDGQYATGETKGSSGNSGGGKQPICVTVQPPLFSHHFGKGAASDITAPGGGFVNKDKEMTPYVRLSTRLNMGRMVGGARFEELVDQFPDDEKESGERLG